LLANVCPYCDRDTEASKEEFGYTSMWAMIAIGVGSVAWYAFGFKAGLAVFVGIVVYSALNTPAVKTPPRNVRIVD
jgi:hypothetical protein